VLACGILSNQPPQGAVGQNEVTRATPSGSPSARNFGPYRFLQRLGEGGMGEVWLAQQVEPVQRQVALKIVKAGMDSARVVARFEAERQALAVMNHPAIAKVFDAGTTPEGRPYFAMEYVRGESLTTYCDRQRLSVSERLELFIQLCEGVQHAHQKGIIHRDLKPSNVLVAITDDRPVPRIIDFGIAKAMAQPLTEHSLFTELGTLIGTPEYMSPEQAEMTPLDVDTRSDVYSLGLLLYELLVGTLPFDRHALRQAGLDEVRRTIRETEAPRPSTRLTRLGADTDEMAAHRRTQPHKLVSLLRGDLDWITMKALEKDRTRRYATANALAMDLRRHLANEPVLAGPPGATYRTRKFIRRHRAAVAAVASLAVLLLVFAAAMTIQAGRIARERDRANQEAATAKQVSDFLIGLFNVSDPGQARGNTLTAREVLARGAAQLENGLQDQPQVRARLQATIGVVYTSLGLFADAEGLLKPALETQRRVLGVDHQETLTTANLLADVYFYLRRLENAESMYHDIIERRTRTLGKDHPATLRTNFDLAGVYLLQQRWSEGEALSRETLASQRRVLGSAHLDTLGSLNNLQYAYYRQGKYVEAEPLAVEVLEGRRRALGEDHPDTFSALHNVATIYDGLGRYGEAESLYLKTVAGKRRVVGDDHPDTCVTLSRLAAMYMKQQRYREAESAALAAYKGYVKRLGDDHASTRQVIEQIATLYTAMGRPNEAAQWRAKLPPK
jgi:non-specific serine/threonine protein kinase/serine/threonine-protein kinase